MSDKSTKRGWEKMDWSAETDVSNELLMNGPFAHKEEQPKKASKSKIVLRKGIFNMLTLKYTRKEFHDSFFEPEIGVSFKDLYNMKVNWLSDQLILKNAPIQFASGLSDEEKIEQLLIMIRSFVILFTGIGERSEVSSVKTMIWLRNSLAEFSASKHSIFDNEDDLREAMGIIYDRQGVSPIFFHDHKLREDLRYEPVVDKKDPNTKRLLFPKAAFNRITELLSQYSLNVVELLNYPDDMKSLCSDETKRGEFVRKFEFLIVVLLINNLEHSFYSYHNYIIKNKKW